jgi:hypothetical protein
VPSEHDAIRILVHRQTIRARSLSAGLRGRKTLRRGSDVTSVILSVYYARISVQDAYIYRYDGQCTIICTAFSRGMFHQHNDEQEAQSDFDAAMLAR